jgi:hypothetical protein
MEPTTMQLAILVCVYFLGVFSCRFFTQFFEVAHAAHIVEKTIYRCLLMCSKIHEDVAFLKELKYKHLRQSGYEEKQIREFMTVDEQITDSWKEGIIQNILINSPRVFSFVTKFTNWKEAMSQLNEMHAIHKGEKK